MNIVFGSTCDYLLLGLLFLGGGNYSLRRDPVSAACLLLSLLPKYPVRTVEQQFHLQAARHLYVLAAEPRALHTVDVDSGETVSVDVDVTLVSGEVKRLVAPGLLPELATIRQISVAEFSEDATGEHDGPPKPRYHGATLVLNGTAGSDKQATEQEDLFSTARTRSLRERYRHTSVPPLFVKKVGKPAYLRAEGQRGVPSPVLQATSPISDLLHHLHGTAGEKGTVDEEVALAVAGNPAFAAVLLSALEA